MKLKKLFNYYIPYVFSKNNLIQKHVVDQSDYFFLRAENIENKDIKKFYIQLICSTMADGYEFFMDILNSKSFFNRFGIVNNEAGKKIYKLNALYYTIKFIEKNKDIIENPNQLKDDMFKIFNFSKHEKKDYNKFLNLHKSNPTQFEVDFSRHVIRSIVGSKGVNPVSLAFVTNFFYSSYKNFINAYTNYVGFNAVFAS